MEPLTIRDIITKKATLFADWSSLPSELLVAIGKCVIKSGSVEEFMAFAGVCTSWRTAAKDEECENLIKSTPMVPILMLPEKKIGEEIEFFSLLKKKVSMKLSLPHQTLGKKLISESRFGWFLAVNRNPYPKPEPELLNPFTGVRFALPTSIDSPIDHALPVLPFDFRTVSRSVLSVDPSQSSTFVLVVLTDSHWLHWRLGDVNWTEVRCRSAWRDVIFYGRDQKFYGIDKYGYVYVWDGSARPPTETRRIGRILQFTDNSYLAESSAGELLIMIVTRRQKDFRVYRLDTVSRVLIELAAGGGCNLDGAIFGGGRNAAFSFVPPPDYANVNCNSICFTHDLRAVVDFPRRDLVICNMREAALHRVCLGAVRYGFDFWVAPSAIPFTSLLHGARNE